MYRTTGRREAAGHFTMNYGQMASLFWRDGYLAVENFFDAARMDPLDARIRAQFGEDSAQWHTDEFVTRAKVEVIPWFPQRQGLRDFDGVESDEHLRSLTEAILGSAWQSLYCMVMYSRDRTKGQAWHQDCAPENGPVHNLNRLVYTSDITAEMGGQTVVVPGSHRQGLIPAGDPEGEFPTQVVLTPKKGMLLLIHGHTWHRVLPILRGPRFSTNYRAMPAGAPENITDICVYRNMRYSFASNSVVEERRA